MEKCVTDLYILDIQLMGMRRKEVDFDLSHGLMVMPQQWPDQIESCQLLFIN